MIKNMIFEHNFNGIDIAESELMKQIKPGDLLTHMWDGTHDILVYIKKNEVNPKEYIDCYNLKHKDVNYYWIYGVEKIEEEE